MKITHRLARFFSFSAVCLVIAGCSNGGSDNVTNLRFINAVTDVPGVDLIVDLDPFLEDVGYLENTDYVEFDVEPHFFQVTPSNSLSPIDETTTTLEDDVDYTYLAYGTPADADAMLLKDDNTPAGGGSFKVRTINVAPSLRSLDVFIVDDPSDITSATPTEDAIRYKGVSKYRYGQAGTYAVVVADSKSGRVLSTVPAYEFLSDGVYTLLLADEPDNGASVKLIVLADSQS